jgi:hypothetical protein
MTPMSTAVLAVIAALVSMGAAATSLYLLRERQRPPAPPQDVRDLEQAVEDLVRRLEATAGRCIHDLDSRAARLRALLQDEPAAESRLPQQLGAAPAVAAGEVLQTDLVSRVARARELADRGTDEATMCRELGMQRAELRLLLSLRAPQQEAASRAS